MANLTRLNLGNIDIYWLGGGEFELDGGTMFGAVPKVLWQQRYPADDENYIKMLNAVLLVRTPDANIIIDTGLGNRFTSKQKDIFRLTRDWSLVEDLELLGLNREDIDQVILTHGDFDHAGGIVMDDPDGNSVLTFPQAHHFIQEREWHDVNHPNSRSIHSYWSANFEPLLSGSQLVLIDGDKEISSGVRVKLCGGHTRGHQLLEIAGDGGKAVHLGDLLPTHAHFNPLWIMAYDNFPLEVVALKEKLLKYYKQDYWFTFYHDYFMKACRLDGEGKIVEKIC